MMNVDGLLEHKFHRKQGELIFRKWKLQVWRVKLVNSALESGFAELMREARKKSSERLMRILEKEGISLF